MNVRIEKAKDHFFGKISSYFSFKIPFFWSFFFFLLNFCFIYLHPSTLSLGLFLLFLPLLSALFRIQGFFIALTIGGYYFSQGHVKNIEGGTLFLSLLLNSLIAWLNADEVSLEFVRLKKEKKVAEDAFLKEREVLEKELQRWIEEAKLRRIDKISDEKKISFLESEIALLNQQKRGLLKKQKPLEKNETNYEGLYKQLKSQFEEKSKTLDQARRELYQKEGKLVSLEKEVEFHLERELLEELFKEFSKEIREKEELEREITLLEELIFREKSP